MGSELRYTNRVAACGATKAAMQINPSSGVANDEHLRYFHFTGRLLGKALFDRQIVAGHLVRPLYKVSVFALLF